MPPGDPPDPLSLHSPLAARLFFGVLERRLLRASSALRLARGSPTAADLHPAVDGRPLVVFCNHPSWWDVGTLAGVLARLVPSRRLFAPFDAAALGRYGFLARCGAFGVEPAGVRGLRRLLDVGGRVLADPRSMLCITPQGAFTDARVRPIVLRRGLATLLARTPGAVALPVALDYPFWSESRPEALARVGAPIVLAEPLREDPARDVDAWQRRLTDGLAATMDALTADAIARDPSRFSVLAEGRAGVGGVYGAWRRLRATARGDRFDGRHAAADARPDGRPLRAPP